MPVSRLGTRQPASSDERQILTSRVLATPVAEKSQRNAAAFCPAGIRWAWAA